MTASSSSIQSPSTPSSAPLCPLTRPLCMDLFFNFSHPFFFVQSQHGSPGSSSQFPLYSCGSLGAPWPLSLAPVGLILGESTDFMHQYLTPLVSLPGTVPCPLVRVGGIPYGHAIGHVAKVAYHWCMMVTDKDHRILRIFSKEEGKREKAIIKRMISSPH